jgi:phospholipid transport system substrate-binding protein
VSRLLAENAGRFGGSTIEIERCAGNLVETSLAGGKALTWRVSGGRIQDVRVSGVWLALQLRSKFTGIIKRNQGDVGALLDYLARISVAAR